MRVHGQPIMDLGTGRAAPLHGRDGIGCSAYACACMLGLGVRACMHAWLPLRCVASCCRYFNGRIAALASEQIVTSCCVTNPGALRCAHPLCTHASTHIHTPALLCLWPTAT